MTGLDPNNVLSFLARKQAMWTAEVVSPTPHFAPMPQPSPEALRQEVNQLKQQVKVLDERIDVLSSRSKLNPALPVNSDVSTGGVATLFGAFCALWAQNTKRNALLWFFCGAIFNVIAVLVLLYKNST